MGVMYDLDFVQGDWGLVKTNGGVALIGVDILVLALGPHIGTLVIG